MATASEPTGVLRDPLQSQRVGFIELIFDAVFVFAFTDLAAPGRRPDLVRAVQGRGAAAGHVVDPVPAGVDDQQVQPDRLTIQLMIVITMLATLLMSAALLHPFSRRELSVVIAATYVAVEVGRHVWLVLLDDLCQGVSGHRR